jgi:hypothetical protein
VRAPTSTTLSPRSSTFRAISTSRQLFDISPGHVCSERLEPLTSRKRHGPSRSACSAFAASTARFAASQSIDRS